MKWVLIFVSLFAAGQPAIGQEHPFLSVFDVRPGFGAVELDWTMTSGNTCFGISILRSFDGLNFEAIGKIEGLCGHLSEPVDYSFVDESPEPFTQHFYRLELGVNGPSSIQSLYFDQIVDHDQLVVYSDMDGEPSIYLRIPMDGEVLLTIYDTSGKLILSTESANGNRISIPQGYGRRGGMVYSVLYNGRRYNGLVVNQI